MTHDVSTKKRRQRLKKKTVYLKLICVNICVKKKIESNNYF